jgi:hypothetical protein
MVRLLLNIKIMKVNLNITLGLVIAALLFVIYLQNGCSRDLKKGDISKDTTEVSVSVPEKSGAFKLIKPKPTVDTIIKKEYIYVPMKATPDTRLLEKYKAENDSLRKEAMYKEAITTNSYLETFSNKDLSITMEAYTTGTLNKLSILSYTIPKQEMKGTSITTSVKEKKYHISLGSEIGIPTRWGDALLFKGNLMIDNKNNMRYNFGIDTQRRIWAGAYITIF